MARIKISLINASEQYNSFVSRAIQGREPWPSVLISIIPYIHVLLIMVLCHGMTSRVALVMAPLLPRIRTGTGNMGLENGGGFKGGGGSRGFKKRGGPRIDSCPIGLLFKSHG